jgi:hypothetical protein
MRSWAALSGLALALVTTAWLVLDGSAPLDEPSTTAESRANAATSDDSAARKRARDGSSLEARVAMLEDEVDSLRREVRTLRARPMTVASSDSPRAEVSPGEPAFEHAVRSVVEQERATQEEARLERRRDQWEARLEELSTELGERAGLGEEQKDQIAGLWSVEAEELLPLLTAARSGEASFRDVREQLEAVRTRTDEQAASLLTPSQLEIYEELRPRGPGGRGGRGGRGNRRDGDGR